MSIFEYNEEQHMKSEREWAYKNGREEGEQRLLQLLQSLMDAGRSEDLSRVLSDSTYREQLYQENNL